MTINFGGYEVTFSSGAEPVYLRLAWPAGTDPSLVSITRTKAVTSHYEALVGLNLISREQRELQGVVFEILLYGRPGEYKAQPIFEWPEEL